MSNPNADRIAALSRQEGTPIAEVTAALASQYLTFAQSTTEQVAAEATLNYAKDWLSLIADAEEPSPAEKADGLALQNLLAKPGGEFSAPIVRLLVAVAASDTKNPNPTPAFGSL